MKNEGKIFVGGIPQGTEEKNLKDYFSKYGLIKKAKIVRDMNTYRSRGFGFVDFFDRNVPDRSGVLVDKHTINGKLVEVKRPLPREELNPTSRTNPKQIFVGGLTPTLDKEGLWQYFETFGKVTNVVIVHDEISHQPRGYGFIHFDTEDAVSKVLVHNFHVIHGKRVEVKQAVLKNAKPGGVLGVNAGGAFDSRVNYVQLGTAVRHSYSGYSSPRYRYGGAYGGYGLGGYGNAGDRPCRNANTSNTLYANRPSQSPCSGASGYGGAAMSGLMEQSPSGVSRYRNQSYGYGNSGGEQHMRSGYIGSNGNSGYPGRSRRSDPPQCSGDYSSRHTQPRQNQAYGHSNFGRSGFDAAGGRSGSSEEQHLRSSYKESNGNSGYPGGSRQNQQ